MRKNRNDKDPENAEAGVPAGRLGPWSGLYLFHFKLLPGLWPQFSLLKTGTDSRRESCEDRGQRYNERLGWSEEYARRKLNLYLLMKYNETEFLLKTPGLRING